MKHTVSIILPVYNAESSIERCINSIVQQSYPCIELIVVNDGSSDGSESILGDLCQIYKDIIYIRQMNSGVSVARNTGIEAASGKYIMFIDADDWISEYCVEAMVASMEKDNSDLCISDWYVETQSGSKHDAINHDLDVIFLADQLYRFYISNRSGCAPWGKLYNRELIKKHHISFIEGLPYAEDYLFNLAYLSIAHKCSYIKQALYHYDCNDPGAGAKVRVNYFQLQEKIESYKLQIVMESPKYRPSDIELLKVAKMKSYINALMYVQRIYTDFGNCYRVSKAIVSIIQAEGDKKALVSTNMRLLNSIYARLALYNQPFGISLLTVSLVKLKKMIGKT